MMPRPIIPSGKVEEVEEVEEVSFEVAIVAFYSLFHFSTFPLFSLVPLAGRPSGRQWFPSRFMGERQHGQAKQERECGQRNGRAQTAEIRDAGGEKKHHGHADEPALRADERDRAAAAI